MFGVLIHGSVGIFSWRLFRFGSSGSRDRHGIGGVGGRLGVPGALGTEGPCHQVGWAFLFTCSSLPFFSPFVFLCLCLFLVLCLRLFCSILFWYVVFYSVLVCFVLFLFDYVHFFLSLLFLFYLPAQGLSLPLWPET